MDIKWKSKLILIIWFVLFTFGLNGLFVGMAQAPYYFNQNYFHTDEFEYKVDTFIDYLTFFELADITRTKVKKEITVTKEEIEEHRYRYGNLNEQITSIRNQYEGQIQDALEAKNEEVANIFIAERDARIADITTNFTSDDHVRQKIEKEKGAEIDQYFDELEHNYKSEYIDFKNSFKYSFTRKDTGKVYTNVDKKDGPVEQYMTSRNMAFVKSYPDLNLAGGFAHEMPYNEQVSKLLSNTTVAFEGKIAVPKTASASNTVLNEYYDYKQRQIVYYIYCLAGIAALIVSFILFKNKTVTPPVQVFEKMEPYYNKIPIDVRIVIFGITVLLALSFLKEGWFLGYWHTIYSLIEGIFHTLFWSTILLLLVLVQGKFLFDRYKDENRRAIFKKDVDKSVLIRTKDVLVGAFINRRVGTQIFIILTLAFCLGFGAILIAIEPSFIIVYVPAFLVVALPVLIIIMKRAGYFNQIVKHTNELANGNFEPDLPIKGKSVLAQLAENINKLKYGVKVSRKEQAKSERLKTELITNVSHDLRTPLTSIITYTELLKTPDLGEDERNSYIEIIDRKSKRLKVLIDDLFEASKMASGNIELIKEKVDLAQLLQQALAEYNEKLDESTLQFRITTPDPPVYAVVDGQKLWRVFDNIIGNLLKYSLENTRVYITMKKEQDYVELSFKNIAKYELGGDGEELFERFKRGDASRQTEGSGLGLAIAKSIVDLHGGEMDIDVDGDLFKVTIKLYVN